MRNYLGAFGQIYIPIPIEPKAFFHVLMLAQLDQPKLFTYPGSILLQGVLENLLDGILILTPQGEQVYMNDAARRICQQINQGQPIPPVPGEIWRVCQTFIDHPHRHSQTPGMIEAEINSGKATPFRVRVRWLPLEDSQHPYLVVLLEDCYQSLHSRAIAEIQKFRLTHRQAEVWLLHRLGNSYREIAVALYISHNTVKKHIKDIHVKLHKKPENNL